MAALTLFRYFNQPVEVELFQVAKKEYLYMVLTNVTKYIDPLMNAPCYRVKFTDPFNTCNNMSCIVFDDYVSSEDSGDSYFIKPMNWSQMN